MELRSYQQAATIRLLPRGARVQSGSAQMGQRYIHRHACCARDELPNSSFSVVLPLFCKRLEVDAFRARRGCVCGGGRRSETRTDAFFEVQREGGAGGAAANGAGGVCT